MKMTIEDVQLLDEIKAYKNVSKPEVAKMQYFMTSFIDAKCHICPHCSGQIRFAHKRIVNWASKNDAMIKSVGEDSFEKAKKQVEKYAANVCKSCGKELTDKRKKYCNKECKDGKG